MQSRERKKEWYKAYYAAHRDEILEKRRAYYKRTYPERRERKNALQREQRKKNDWYRKNAEKIKAARKEWYRENRDEVRKRQNERSAEKRKMVLDRYGGKCACCGETEYKFLCIDHINGDGKKHRQQIGSGGGAIYRWLIKNNFPSGFQVLCHNCNQAKGFYGVCPHQERKNN